MRPHVPTRSRLRVRQGLLFVLAIGLPCLVLVALSLRMIAQERELAEKRLADERRRIVVDVRQQLRAALDRLRLQALNSAQRHAPAAPEESGGVVFVAAFEGNRLVLPWDSQPDAAAAAAALGDPPFATAVRDGERDELVTRRLEGAVASYRRALSAARVPAQTALAQLLVARALEKTGQTREASSLYRRLLSATPLVVDEHGVPFALYAARRMLDSREPEASELTGVLEALPVIGESSRPLAPAAVFMMRDVADTLAKRLAGSANAEAAGALVRSVDAMARDLEQALALQEAFPSLAARFATNAGPGANPVWAPFGERPNTWLVALAPGEPVVAIRADRLLALLPAVRDLSLDISANAGGEALGPEFPGLSLSFSGGATGALAGPSPLQRSFYTTVLVVVVSMTLLGGYLFWRDVRREVTLAELRSQFVSSVSHELKTPLTAIRMFAETLLLGRSERRGTREDYLETIVNESERLTRLLNNVLDFSKIEQGRKLYRLEPHSLGAIVRRAARTMHYPLSQQGFDLRVSIDDRLPPVAADADAVEQAILNLLSNAMKYSGQSRSIDLHVRRDGDCALVSVTDRGLGIPPHEQGRIFEKFYRIGGADREGIPGTGLGLTLVEHVARGHGGEVKVESVPGEGSTFSIVLPLLQASAGAAPPEEALA